LNSNDVIVYVVDDEEDIRELILYNMQNEGINAKGFMDANALLCSLEENTSFVPSLIVLDLMMPGMSGLDLCRRLKKNILWKSIPILMLTAKSEESDIVLGLELGADDYVTKPFSIAVLNARIRALLRRSDSVDDEDYLDSSSNHKKGIGTHDYKKVVSIYDIDIDLNKFSVRKDGKKVSLTKSEFQILLLFSKNPGWVYSRSQIINQLKGSDYPVTERSIDVQIRGLRVKLGDDGSLIKTVRGVGYKLKGNDE